MRPDPGIFRNLGDPTQASPSSSAGPPPSASWCQVEGAWNLDVWGLTDHPSLWCVLSRGVRDPIHSLEDKLLSFFPLNWSF